MAYPDLYKDESKILDAQNIKVKSVSFDAILTTRRLILMDRKKATAPPQEILLATLKNVDSGENAIRDPTITLSIITSTGSTRQMILTFSKTSGGERKREADEWMKVLRQNVSQTIRHPVLPDIPGMEDEEPLPIPPVSTPAVPPSPRVEIVNAPPQKKRIEISRPMKKIIESPPAMPQPVETTTLPVGSFCNRCGSRVPPESAFCNHCGTPVVKESDLEAALRGPLPQETVPEPAPVVPQVAVPVPPVFGQGSDKKERPIEEVIHSIEPLIEDSVPRTEPAPLIEKTRPAPAPEPVVVEEKPQPPETGVQWPVISSPAPEPGVPPVPQAAPQPQPVPEKGSGKRGVMVMAVLAVAVLAIIAGVFLFANPLQQPGSGLPVTTPVPTVTSTTATTPSPAITEAPGTTTPVTTIITETPAPQATTVAVSIPTQGVWIRITYANRFIGTVGTPGAERDVGDTGDKLYQISTSTGTAVASVKKKDGSADELAVELYKDGNLVTRKSTTAPNGLVEIQVSLKPAPTATPTQAPTPVPTTSVPATGNATVNATVTTTGTP